MVVEEESGERVGFDWRERRRERRRVEGGKVGGGIEGIKSGVVSMLNGYRMEDLTIKNG